MPTITFNGRELTARAARGDTLLSCIRRSGLGVESTCGGRGVCGKCRVIAHGKLSPPDEEEREHLIGQPADVRLACRARVLGNVSLTARLQGDRYYLTDTVFLSQRDIRQVQLAKSAAVTGILTLLREAGRSVADLEHIVIAGSFGYHLNPENLKRIGLLPAQYKGKITSVGNSSLSGASLALLNRHTLRDMERLASLIQVLDLSSHADFRDLFVSHLDFSLLEKQQAGRLGEVSSCSPSAKAGSD